MGFLRKPELAVLALSPLSLALLSLTRDALLSPRASTVLRSESTERFGACTPLTAFLRWSGTEGAGAGAGLLFAFFEGERVKRGSHECECDS